MLLLRLGHDSIACCGHIYYEPQTQTPATTDAVDASYLTTLRYEYRLSSKCQSGGNPAQTVTICGGAFLSPAMNVLYHSHGNTTHYFDVVAAIHVPHVRLLVQNPPLMELNVDGLALAFLPTPSSRILFCLRVNAKHKYTPAQTRKQLTSVYLTFTKIPTTAGITAIAPKVKVLLRILVETMFQIPSPTMVERRC